MSITIKLTESKLRKLIISALNESLSYNEYIKDNNGNNVTDQAILAVGWRDAVLDKMNGGPGVSKYCGRDYTAMDWIASLQLSTEFFEYCLDDINRAIGSVIKEKYRQQVAVFLNKTHKMGIRRLEEFDTRPDLKNNEYVQNLLHKANTLEQPGDDVKRDIYSDFFYDTDKNCSLLGQSDKIAMTANGKTASDVLRIIKKYLRTYSISKFKDWLKQGGNINTTIGNTNLSDPVFREDDYEGYTYLSNTYEKNMIDRNAESPEDMGLRSKDNIIDPLKKIKYMFGLILSGQIKVKNPSNGGMVDAATFIHNIKGNGTKLKCVVKYIYDHFNSVFDMKAISKDYNSRITGRNVRGEKRTDTMEMTAMENCIKERVSKFLYNAYQRAYEANDKSDYIVNMFKQTNSKHVLPKTPEDFSPSKEPVKYLWPLIKCTQKDRQNSQFAFGDSILDKFVEHCNMGLVSESRKRKPIRLSERKLKRIISESVNKILNRYY